jgi:PBP superfamily domain
VATTVYSTPFSIGYIEQAYSMGLLLRFAAIRNQAGNYVTPSAQTVAVAAAQRPAITPTDFSIVNQPGAASYPISGYSWALIYTRQTDQAKAGEPGRCFDDGPGRGSAQAQGAQGAGDDRDRVGLAKACSQPGMVATETRAELVKNRMMMGNSPASPADSGSRTVRPSSRLSQEKATPAATANAAAARAAAGPAWNRKPVAIPTDLADMGGLGRREGSVPAEVRMRGRRVQARSRSASRGRTAIVTVRPPTKIAALLPAIVWAPFFLALATPGTAVEDEPGHLARVVGVPANLVPATLIPIICALGYTLHRHGR